MVRQIEKMQGEIKQLPDIVGLEAMQLFRENFIKEGWQDKTFSPWKRKKYPDGGRILASPRQRGDKSLMNSIHILSKSDKSVTVGVDGKPYARIHNEGGTIPVPTTEKLRKWAWAMFYKTGDNMYKAMAITKEKHIKVSIPKRQYMGNSQVLWDRVVEVLHKHFNAILTPKKHR